MSTKVALEQLGFGPCYHMSDSFQKAEHVQVWLSAKEAAPVDWGALFAGYEAALDWPSSTFYRQLMVAFPDAKVVLNVRNAGAWYESMAESLHALIEKPPPGLSPTSSYVRLARGIIWDGTFGGKFGDRAHAISVYERHNEDVQKRVPSDRLLVFEVGEGWGPLCAFLGVPAPQDRPFPRTNDRQTLMTLVPQLIAMGHPAFR
jgi:hypothetical protein